MLLSLIQKHPVLLSFYALYLLLFIGEIRSDINFKNIDKQNHAAGISIGEGPTFALVWMVIIGISLLFAATGYLAIAKRAKWFYVALFIIAIVPMIVLIGINK